MKPWLVMALLVGAPGLALAGDPGTGAVPPRVDLDVAQRAARAPDGGWEWALGGSAVLPVLDVTPRFRLGLRLSSAGQIDSLSAHWGLGLNTFTLAEALSWNGRLDRGPNDQVAISFVGRLRLDALADRLGLPRTPWVELGLQTRVAGADAVAGTRWSSTLVLAVDLDLADPAPDRRGRTASGFRIRASAALGDDPGCGLGTPSLLFSGRCLTLALAIEF